VTAIISDCGLYRYRLEREIGLFGSPGAFIMINPSVADGEIDDPTIRRIVGFAKSLGWSKVIVGNLFAYRTPDVRELARVPDPVGPENASHLKAIFEEVATTVVAWGPCRKLPSRLRDEWRNVVNLSIETERDLLCLEIANDGHPRHPLMLKKDSRPRPWHPPLD